MAVSPGNRTRCLPDLVIVKKPDIDGVDVQTVRKNVVTKRVVTDDTLALRINRGQHDDVNERTGIWQFRVVKVGVWCQHRYESLSGKMEIS